MFKTLKFSFLQALASSLSLIVMSCAPVKYSKSDSQVIGEVCRGDGCSAAVARVQCDPKINGTQNVFAVSASAGSLPSISSNCLPADAVFSWSVRKADASRVVQNITGLNGASPASLNFSVLGTGAYYVFLTAKKSGMADFVAATPLEFVVSGDGVGSGLTCDPKLNGSAVNMALSASEPVISVTANCVPGAGAYLWTATKDDKNFVVPGLSGARSQPDFRALGPGVYKLNLYATATGSTHWQTAAPLVVTVPTGMAGGEKNLICNPQINGTMNSALLTSASPHPLLSANCLAEKLQYQWSVVKNGLSLSVPELTGANANPNFVKLGKGTYSIFLKVEGENKSQWNSSEPLLVTVADDSPAPTINCSPRLNGERTALTLSAEMKNPTLTANCSPANVNLQWRVLKNGKLIELADLKGATSVPQIIGSGEGTYEIYLSAEAEGHNAYFIPSPLEVTVNAQSGVTRKITLEQDVKTQNQKLDVLLVVDDSNSMLSDNTKLAQKLESFVKGLTASGVQWQMCATVTRWQDDNPDKIKFWGGSRKWVNYIGNPQWLLTPGANNLSPIFNDTIKAIGAGWANSDDERGIKAALYNIEYGEFNNCYRSDAALAVIVISDEDVRSIGGNPADIYYDNELQYLEPDDYPAALVAKVREKFGQQKQFTFNSIIVKPGDEECMRQQDIGGSKSHYGYHYSELSELSGGMSASICDNDYANTLGLFKERIANSMASVPLDCPAVGAIKTTVTPAMGGYSAKLENNRVVFNPAVPAGRKIKVEYQCSAN